MVARAVSFCGRASAAILILGLGVACGTPSPIYVEATRAIAPNPDEQLAVAISVFDPGFGAGRAPPERSSPQVLLAEANYLPNLLRTTMVETGQWSSVHVVPETRPGSEVTIEGTILESNGLALGLEIEAYDATGRSWLSKRYRIDLDGGAYAVARTRGYDPYQPLFHRIANDLLAARDSLPSDAIRRTRSVAEMRFAADLAPDPFSSYVERGGSGKWELVRLPAGGDPMLQRIGSIRERDTKFLDSLTGHYTYFAAEMEERGYLDLRETMMLEEVAYQETRREAGLRTAIGVGAILGALAVSGANPAAATIAADLGMEVARDGMAMREEAEIHREAIEELVVSFDVEVTPLVLDVRGETVRLQGTAAAQYGKWRKLLAALYRAETEIPAEGP